MWTRITPHTGTFYAVLGTIFFTIMIRRFAKMFCYSNPTIRLIKLNQNNLREHFCDLIIILTE